MISSEVQRTLVKSPPELWAELSDPDALARHLGELGEITITRVEPEKTVEWEAADTTGKVLLKASGWGTKVTLTVIREVVAPEPPADPKASAIAIAIAIADESVPPEPEPTAQEKPELEAILEEPEPRPGFFARFFRRRRKDQALPDPPVEPELAIDPELLSDPPVEPELAIDPELAPKNVASPPDLPDIAAELKAAEEAATEEVTAVLTAALDRLGAAHHRPFSRA